MKVLYIRLPDEVKDSIEEEANKRSMTITTYVSIVLMAHKKIMQSVDKSLGGKNG